MASAWLKTWPDPPSWWKVSIGPPMAAIERPVSLADMSGSFHAERRTYAGRFLHCCDGRAYLLLSDIGQRQPMGHERLAQVFEQHHHMGTATGRQIANFV